MANHLTLPFDTLHKAKFDAGLDADLPASPEGIGDIYFATDTAFLYIADTAGTAWVAYDLSATIGGGTEEQVYIGLIGI